MACINIEFVSFRHCFIGLPRSLVDKLTDRSSTTVFRVHSIKEQAPSVCYLSWNGQLSSNNHLQIDGTFAVANGLVDGQAVVLESVEPGVTYFHDCISAEIEPVADDDQGLLLMHFEDTESKLLRLVKYVNQGMVIPIWPNSSNIYFKIRVSSINPDSSGPVQLNDKTELHLSHQPNYDSSITVRPRQTTILYPFENR